MWSDFRRLLTGLNLLRRPEIVRWLGEESLRRQQLAALRTAAPGAKISDSVVLIGHAADRLVLGRGAQVREGSVLAFGDEAGGYGHIAIGANTWIGQYNNLRASAGADIRIGAGCLISQFCTLVGSQHAHAAGTPIQAQGDAPGPRGIELRDDVWLGAGVVVTAGVRIGNGAVIGANAVVTCSVPAGEIWAGVPARKIGERG